MGITLLTIDITLLIREFSLLFGISFTWDVTEIVVKFASLLRNGLKYAAKKKKKSGVVTNLSTLYRYIPNECM